jgi:NADPH:quinone reductase
MKTLLSKQPGPPESLELSEVADPTAAAGEVVIAIKAAGVNFPDALIIEDRCQFKPPRPFAPGAEVAGVIESIGPGVTRFAVGDRVVATVSCGGYAEKIALREDRCWRMPGAMPFEEAAAFMFTYATSYYALQNRAELKSGETLLVLGAAGGVGAAAVQLGKAFAARVIGAVSSAQKAAFAKRCGADDTLVYPSGKLSKEQSRALAADFKRVCGGGADVIYDAVGGDYCEPALRTMNYEGRYLVIGFPAGIPAPPLNLTLLKNCSIVGVFLGAFMAREPDQHRRDMDELFKLYAQGKIRPQISATYALADGGKAIRALMERRATGKIVIVV